MNSDAIVVGGGVMGLMSARELASRGLSVTVIDRGPLAGEASWAGGGIVSPLYPWRYDQAVSALSQLSQQAYATLAPALHLESGVDPELRQKGLLMMAVADTDAALAWAGQQGAALEQVEAEFARRLEPRVRLAEGPLLWMPTVASIRNPRLGRALVASLQRNPRVRLLAGEPVEALLVSQGRVTGVKLLGQTLSADNVMICGGAWSRQLLAPLGIALPVEPVKGQMMLFKTDGMLLDRVVLANGRYLIPRSDGRILVGSTLERTGFSKQVTAAAYQSLYQSAVELLPELRSQPVEAQWAGLRPGSPQGIPFIGEVPGVRNLFLNAGHFRNGLVLAPASCRLVAELVCGETPSLDPAPYGLDAERGNELL
ncbi:NAD(P)/FAD-dependent oxidoreductase [Motiliproteus sediminis]|uniref:NAD(P)/FAD-dependent oxidoreductase n=1 Tax=Motiliproteus sediminis TaxID=1468178 RepID=UPI0031BBA71A